MRLFTKKMTFTLKGLFRLGRKKAVDIDLVILENLQLMKEIRMNRMKFYKFYKKAMS
jgi:hypothetical protein